MISMTGYGESNFTLLGIRFYYRIKSLNSRFLETKYILPTKINWFEIVADELIKKRFDRGKFEIFLETNQAIPQELKLNTHLIHEYQKLFSSMYPKRKINLPIEILVQLPGLFELTSPSLRKYSSKIELHFIKSLSKLERQQEKEGNKIHRLIKTRLRLMSRTSRKISILSQQHLKKQEKLAKDELTLMKKALTQANPELLKEENRNSKFLSSLKEEILQIMYSDITEEIDRLNIHLALIDQFIEKEKYVGKKIEFFLQEMLREVNTLTAKTKNTKINLLGIQLKSEIEKIREHARNVI